MPLCTRHRLRRLRPEGRALAAADPAAAATILVTAAAAKAATAAAAKAAAAVAPASKYASWDALLELLLLHSKWQHVLS